MKQLILTILITLTLTSNTNISIVDKKINTLYSTMNKQQKQIWNKVSKVNKQKALKLFNHDRVGEALEVIDKQIRLETIKRSFKIEDKFKGYLLDNNIDEEIYKWYNELTEKDVKRVIDFKHMEFKNKQVIINNEIHSWNTIIDRLTKLYKLKNRFKDIDIVYLANNIKYDIETLNDRIADLNVKQLNIKPTINEFNDQTIMVVNDVIITGKNNTVIVATPNIKVKISNGLLKLNNGLYTKCIKLYNNNFYYWLSDNNRLYKGR